MFALGADVMPNKKQFIVWVDYGCDSFCPFDFDSIQKMLDFIQKGVSGPFVATERLVLGLEKIENAYDIDSRA